eukprot:5229010-Pyramimonas_sp.AAC.1
MACRRVRHRDRLSRSYWPYASAPTVVLPSEAPSPCLRACRGGSSRVPLKQDKNVALAALGGARRSTVTASLRPVR